MKKLIAALTLLIVAALGAPAWFGKLTEDRLREALADEASSPYLAAEVTAYQRGWLHSSGVIALRLSDRYLNALFADPSEASALQAALRDGHLTVNVEVGHGPVVLGDEPFFGVSRTVLTMTAPDTAADFMQQAGLTHLLRSVAETAYDGSTDIVASVPAIRQPIPGGARIDFSGLDVSAHYDPGAGRLDGRLTMASLALSDDTTTVQVDALHIDSDSTRISPGVALAQVTAGIDGISVNSTRPALGSVEMERLTLTSNVTQNPNDGTLDIAAEYRLGALLTPAMTLTDGRFGVTLERLSVTTLQAYNAWAEDLSLGGNVAQTELQAELAELVATALQDGPVLTLEPVSAVYDGQPIEGRLAVTVDPAALPPRQQMRALDPLLLIPAISIHGELAADRSLVRRIAHARLSEAAGVQAATQDPQPAGAELTAMIDTQVDAMLTGLLQQGLISEDGGQYRTELAFEHGQAAVNGQVMPLPGLP